jgi:hypothetical protein
MLNTFLTLALVYANEAIDYADEMHAWVCLTQRSSVKAEAEWRNGHVYRAYFTGLDDDDLEYVARLHWAVKVLISGDKLTVNSPLTLVAMRRLRFLVMWGDQFKPYFRPGPPNAFVANRLDVLLRFYNNRDPDAIKAEKVGSVDEDHREERRRKELANPPRLTSFQ